MTDDAYTAAELPDIRSRLVADLSRPPHASPAFEAYALHASIGMQVPADPSVRDPARQAGLLVAAELHRLRNASLYWVSPEMTRLCLAAAPDMPPFRPRHDDLPAPYGLIYFAAPIGDYQPWLQDMVFEFDNGRTRDHKPPARGYRVCAATWGPWDQYGRWRRGGTWFTFYTGGGTAEEMTRIHGVTTDEAHRLAGLMPPLRIDNECKVPVCASDDPPDAIPMEDAVRDPGTTAYWAQLVLCAFRLMETAAAARTSEHQVPRPARRRAQRARVACPAGPVRLVDIAAGSVRQDRPADGEGTSRAYRVRWIVSGHWRSQWYPASEVHRPKWISPYVKGPAHAPLQVRERVNVWRGPGETNPDPGLR